MKVMVVHNRYRAAAPSGENRVVDQESEALGRAGHEVLRFERSSDEVAQWSLASKASIPARVIWNPEAHRGLLAALRGTRPDVVHVHNTFPLLSAAVLYACRDAAVPVVATIHNRRLVCASGDFFRDGALCRACAHGLPIPALIHGCYRDSRLATAPVAVAAYAHRRAWRSLVSAYLFVSASLRDQLAELHLPPGRVFLRHPLVPHHAGAHAPRRPAVLYAGRLDEAKGVRLLMAGWDRYRAMPSAAPDLRLVIAGSGPLEGLLRGWASDRPCVEVLGQVSKSRCAGLMAGARAVILPSICEESFGLVAVEAMAAGTPPVAAAHGALAEVITPGADGVLFAPGDPASLAAAIADIAAYPARYEGYGERARATYERRFDPCRSLTELIGIYQFAIAHPVAARRLSWGHDAIAAADPVRPGAAGTAG